MSHRNATDAKQEFRNAAREFRETYLPRIAEARSTYAARNAGGVVPEDVDVALEAHGRNYLIDSLLAALNWNITSASGAYLANLIPENPIHSFKENETRYIDYLGLETNTKKPLLVVEAKRPGSPPPARKTPKDPPESLSEILLAGLKGAKLHYDWDKWLGQVRDYVKSIKQQTNVCPKRVVITDGEWLFVFLEPEALFLNSATAKATDIRAFVVHDAQPSIFGEIDSRFAELYGMLEYGQLAESLPPISPAELLFHFEARDILEGLRGLLVNYVSFGGQWDTTPLVEITPLIFLRKPGARWLRVELKNLKRLPSDAADLPTHLQEVAALSTALRDQIVAVLPGNHIWLTLQQHYADKPGFEQLPGVRESQHRSKSGNQYVVITGSQTHYLREQPSVSACPYHQWTRAKAEGVAAPDHAAITLQSTDPDARVWFADGSTHHCAHKVIDTIKSKAVVPANRSQCGTRSARDHEAFCEIRGFERHLCCRTCNFESVCESAAAFQPPCHRV